MTTTGAPAPELDSAIDVLEFARDRRAVLLRAEADLLLAAVTWAEQHPPESIDDAAMWVDGGDTGLPLAGPGAPLVAEFCIAELAAALGESTDSGRARIAHAVELKYRLPRLWARVQRVDLPAWRARRVAETTLGLSTDAARYVDTQVAAFAHKIGPAALDRLIAEAIARFMPDQALEDARSAADRRHFTIHHDHVTFDGTSRVEAELDLADALDLEDAIARGAATLKAAGSGECLDVRRSIAAGDLARHQLALDLSAPADQPVKPRQVVLHVHLSDAAVRGTSNALDLARVEKHRQVVTADQVRTWCANPDTTVVVKPVIDLSEHIHVEGYEIPDRLREQTEVRDHTCAFPWCTRSARRCDCDHVIAHDRGGPTCSCNIAPLCRRHHRLKTHSAWTYTLLEPGSYLWSSPHGYQFLRDHEGTLDVTSKTTRRSPTPAHPPDDT